MSLCLNCGRSLDSNACVLGLVDWSTETQHAFGMVCSPCFDIVVSRSIEIADAVRQVLAS